MRFFRKKLLKYKRLAHGLHRHTATWKSFAKIRHEMDETTVGVIPSIPVLVRRNHTRKSETYVENYTQEVVEEEQSLATQILSPTSDTNFYPEIASQQGSTVTSPSPVQLDENVPTVEYHRDEFFTTYLPRQLHMKTELADMNRMFTNLAGKVTNLDAKVESFQESINLLVRMLVGTSGSGTLATTTPQAHTPPQSQLEPHLATNNELRVVDYNALQNLEV